VPIQHYEIDHYLALLRHYHAEHEADYGPIEKCAELTCVEAKLSIIYLQHRHAAEVRQLSQTLPGSRNSTRTRHSPVFPDRVA